LDFDVKTQNCKATASVATSDARQAQRPAYKKNGPPADQPIHRTVATLIALCFFFGCEMSNYAPPVTAQMATTSRGKQVAALSALDRGRTLFVHRCIECHTLPAMWKYTPQDWKQIVNDMSHRASLKPADRDAVIAYILAARSN